MQEELRERRQTGQAPPIAPSVQAGPSSGQERLRVGRRPGALPLLLCANVSEDLHEQDLQDGTWVILHV